MSQSIYKLCDYHNQAPRLTLVADITSFIPPLGYKTLHESLLAHGDSVQGSFLSLDMLFTKFDSDLKIIEDDKQKQKCIILLNVLIDMLYLVTKKTENIKYYIWGSSYKYCYLYNFSYISKILYEVQTELVEITALTKPIYITIKNSSPDYD